MSAESQLMDERRSRRGVLALAAGAGAALTTLFGRTERAAAADGDPLILGASNSASNGTGLGASVGTGFVLGVRNLSSGPAAGGIQAQSSSGGKPAVAGENDASDGIAVFGASNGPGGFGQGSGNGVQGESGSGTGVTGRSSSGFGVSGESEDGIGGAFQSTNGLALDVNGAASFVAGIAGAAISVENQSADPAAAGIYANGSGLAPVIVALSDASPSPTPDTAPPTAIAGVSTGGGRGVQGSGDLMGVDGNSPSGIGVHGGSETGIGGLFDGFEGVGLGVTGRAAFQTVGAGTVPAGRNSVFVDEPFVRQTSHISVTLIGNPGSRSLQWVRRVPGSGFTVNLSSAPANQRPATPFTYFVAEHQEPLKGG